MTDLSAILQKVLDAVVVMRCDGTVADWNGCAESTFGWTRAEAIGRSMSELIIPQQHREAHAKGLQRYLEGGEAHVLDRRIEITALDRGGNEFPVELTITQAQDGHETVFIGFIRNIAERKTAEAALRESEARLSATYNHAFVGIAEADADGHFLRANEQFSRITGYSLDELRQQSIFSITHPGDVPPDRDQYARQWSGELDNYTLEKRYIRKDGTIVWVEVAASIVRGAGGEPAYAVRIVRDVSERKAAERHQHLLLTELNHRVKNILTVVQALVTQSFKNEAVSPQALQNFNDRLTALAKAHDVLVSENWLPTPLSRVVEESLRPFDLSRFEIGGPTVLLPPQTAVTFALAMHELATNATKYGALSAHGGRVQIAWNLEDQVLKFTWREAGGPAVRPPARRGFGSRLLEQGLARELRGTVQLEYPARGLECVIAAPDPSVPTGA